jgi:NAD(P)-dependent dehydrogenase (short-subunit alcohol dehydrogenase family)
LIHVQEGMELDSIQKGIRLAHANPLTPGQLRLGLRPETTKDRRMNFESKTILITGASRGIGRALVEESLTRNVKRVYAGTRQAFTHSDKRVTLVMIDVTNEEQIKAAIESIASLDILINNAGVDHPDNLNDSAGIERHLAVNLFGTHRVTEAFLPLLVRSQGTIVNVLSLASLASVPFSPAYSISKAAAFSMTQSYRALWAASGVGVHAVFPGPVDTDMARSLDIPKASPESVARAILDGVERGDEDIFPDPMSAGVANGWRNGAGKALERQFAAYTPESMAKDQ